MSKKPNKKKQKFQKLYDQFKDNHQPEQELKNIFEIYLPFWFCRRNVVAEKEVELDRFSKVILQTIQSGLIKHSEICKFLGVAPDSFVTSQFHFLIKKGLLDEVMVMNDSEYVVTHEGISFLERKSKVSSFETIGFDYHFNDLTLELFDINKPLESNNLSTGRKQSFGGYRLIKKERVSINRVQIPCSNKGAKFDTVSLSKFFNSANTDCSFYDFESDREKRIPQWISFLALEYIDRAGMMRYDIRQFEETVRGFNDEFQLEPKLSESVTKYFKRHPRGISQ